MEKQVAIIRDMLKRVNTELGKYGVSVGATEVVAEDAKWQKWRLDNIKVSIAVVVVFFVVIFSVLVGSSSCEC